MLTIQPAISIEQCVKRLLVPYKKPYFWAMGLLVDSSLARAHFLMVPVQFQKLMTLMGWIISNQTLNNLKRTGIIEVTIAVTIQPIWFVNPNKAVLFEGIFFWGGVILTSSSYYKKNLANVIITLYNC